MLGRKAQSGRTRQGPPAVWPSRRIEGPWLRARCRKSGGTRYLGIGRPCLLEDARPHHHPGRNRPLPFSVATPMGADGRAALPDLAACCDRLRHCTLRHQRRRRTTRRFPRAWEVAPQTASTVALYLTSHARLVATPGTSCVHRLPWPPSLVRRRSPL